MALSTSVTALLEYVESAEEVRDGHLEFLDDLVGRLHGSYWRGDNLGVDYDYAPENVYFQYLSLMVPRLVFDNPGVRVTSKRSGPQSDVAQALQSGLARWVQDANMRRTLEQIAMDMLIMYGVGMVSEEPRVDLQIPKQLRSKGAKGGTATWPVMRRISPRQYIVDPDARTWDEVRFQGHEWRIDKDDLLERAKKNPDEGWELEAIEALAADVKPEDLDTIESGKSRPHRNQIRAYEIWMPEHEDKDHPGASNGFHGTIFTVSVDQPSEGGSADPEEDGRPRGKMLRKPRPYYGPATGPYCVFGAYTVPDSVFPLSPLVATEGQINELNTHELAAAASMQNHKRIVAVRDAKTAREVKNLQHDFVFVADFDHNGKPLVQEVEIGGHTDHQREWIERSRQRVDRVLGIDDAMRGAVSGAGTATEHSIASESSSTRLGFLKQKFTDSTAEALRCVAHFMYYSDTIVFPVGVDDYDASDPMSEPWFQGGDEDMESGYSFADLELSIEPFSMERANEGLTQQRVLESHQILLNSMPTMAQFPNYPWREHFKKIGASINIPGLHELITEDFLAQLGYDAEMMRQANLAGAEGPKLAKQVGPAGPQRMQPIGPTQPQGNMQGQDLAAMMGGAMGGAPPAL